MSNYEQLKNTSKEGDFVLEGQTLAKDEGFRNVSKIWYDKTLSFDEALEKLDSERKTQHDFVVKGKLLAPYFNEETGEVGLEDWQEEKRYRLTPHAWRQYAGYADVCTTYVNDCLAGSSFKASGKKKYDKDIEDARTFYNVMKNGHRHMADDRKLLIRTYDDNVCRAVLTDKYTTIDNRWFIETLGKLLPGGRVSHWDKSNADTLGFNVLIPDTIRAEEDSEYGGMVSVTNCEIGTRKNSGYPSLFRAICMNGCIWGAIKGTNWSQVHKGKIDYNTLSKIMLECIDGQIKLVDDVVEKYLAAREWEFGKAKPTQLIACFSKENNLGKSQIAELFQGFAKEKQNQNAFGFINGITRFAQTQPADVWQSFDMMAGKMIEAGKDGWDAFAKRAEGYSEKDLEKIFSKNETLNSNFNLIAV